MLCDFDGTIVNIDTAEFVLARFAEGDWRVFDEQLEKGEITFEECLRRQFSLVRAPKTQILKELEQATFFRPNFEKLVGYCRIRGLPFIIVSGGLDFVIRHFLEPRSWLGLIEIHAAKARCTVNGIKFTFPTLLDKTSVSFKDDLVRYYKKQGNRVIYIGDGLVDYNAARNADFSFTVKGSRLAELCKRGGFPHREISDFQEVVEVIKSFDDLG